MLKESLGGWTRNPKRSLYEVVGIKPKFQWILPNVRGTRNMECLPRRAAGGEWRQPKREVMLAVISKARGQDHL